MWRKSECGAVEGWHAPFITPEWIKEDRDTSFCRWPSHPEPTPALTSRRSSPPRVTMQTTPTRHKRQSRKTETNGSEEQSDMRRAPEGKKQGGRNHLDSSQLQELAFAKGSGHEKPRKLICSALFLFFRLFSNHHSSPQSLFSPPPHLKSQLF